MTNILHMDTDLVRSVSQQLSQASEAARAQLQSLNGNVQSLNWQGPGRDMFVTDFERTNQALYAALENANALSQRLQREADEWETVAADSGASTGSGALFAFPLAPSKWPILPIMPYRPDIDGSSPSWPTLPIMPYRPGIDGSSWVLLGGLTSVPVAGGGFAMLSDPNIGITKPKGMFDIPDWAIKLLCWFARCSGQESSKPSQTAADSTIGRSSTVSASDTTFGDLLTRSDTQNATPSASVAPSQPIQLPNTYTNYQDTPVKAQGILGGNAGCTPTSVSMVLDYFHAKNPTLPARSPDELFQSLDKGDFTYGKGMSPSNITDELNDLGYKNVHAQVGASLDDLKSQLSGGPVIVTGGVQLTTQNGARAIIGSGNTTHAMVVTGVSDDNAFVLVNDPWSGKQLEFPMETFQKMWDKGSKGLYAIRP